MILYICRAKDCGYFRDMTALAFSVHPEYFSNGNVAQKVQYNTSVTHCPHGHGMMYQVQKGDRLAVIAEDEKE